VHAVQGSSEVIKPTIAERSYLRLAIGDAIGGDGDAHRHGSGRGWMPRAEIESVDLFPRLSLRCVAVQGVGSRHRGNTTLKTKMKIIGRYSSDDGANAAAVTDVCGH
jgi:hypothetical protein